MKALIGNGGHAREVIAQMNLKTMIRFVDDEYWDNSDSNVKPLSEFDPNKYTIMIAVGDSEDRKKIFDKLPKETKFFTFIHPSAQIFGQDFKVGEGSFIGANSMITCNVNIGKHAILNRGVQIGHDSKIGDFFSAMPGSIVSGNVEIGNYVYLGSNSVIKEIVSIKDNITVGALACLVKDAIKSGIYVGVPAKIK